MLRLETIAAHDRISTINVCLTGISLLLDYATKRLFSELITLYFMHLGKDIFRLSMIVPGNRVDK